MRSFDRLMASSCAERNPQGMTALDPQVTGALCAAFAAASMIMLGRVQAPPRAWAPLFALRVTAHGSRLARAPAARSDE